MRVRTGDRVRITYGNQSIDGRVTLASRNGRSLMLEWDDGMLGGFAGSMAVLDGQDLLFRRPVTVEPIERHD